MLNDFAFVGVRICSSSMIGSFALVPVGPGQPGAFGSLLPFAAYQSAGNALDELIAWPCWNATYGGSVWPTAAALPDDSTANELPARTVVPPNEGRIECWTGF